MRTIAAIAMAALLVACGDDDDGNGGGGNDIRLTGTITATLTNGVSTLLSGTCSDLGDTQISAALVAVSTASDLCAAYTSGREPANATTVVLTIAKFNVSGAATPLDAGSYAVLASGALPVPDLQGNVRLAFVAATRSGGPVTGQPFCAELGGGVATGGSVTLTSATASTVSGTVSATLDDGTTVTGSFAAAACGAPVAIDPATCEPTVPDTTSCG